jgi:hypothetical protein
LPPFSLVSCKPFSDEGYYLFADGLSADSLRNALPPSQDPEIHRKILDDYESEYIEKTAMRKLPSLPPELKNKPSMKKARIERLNQPLKQITPSSLRSATLAVN